MVIRSPENGQCGAAFSARENHQNWRKSRESRNPVPSTRSLRELTPFVVTALFAICKKLVTSSRNRHSPAVDGSMAEHTQDWAVGHIPGHTCFCAPE